MSNSAKEQSLAERLAFIRARQGLSQEAFARSLGVSRSAYQHYERGEHEVPSSLLSRICLELDVHPVWLLLDNGGEILRDDRKRYFHMHRQLEDFVTARALGQGKALSETVKREIIDIIADDFSDALEAEDANLNRTEEKVDNIIRLIAA